MAGRRRSQATKETTKRQTYDDDPLPDPSVSGSGDGPVSLRGEPLSEAMARAVREKKFNGLKCCVCGKPQFTTPGGDTCENGHGGADGLTAREWAEEQREKKTNKFDAALKDERHLPTMGGFDGLVERFFRVDPDADYNELERALKLNVRAHDASYAQIVDALDDAADNARRAHLLYINARVALEALEIDSKVIRASMREQALERLTEEKKSGERTKQITEGDIEAKMASLFPDEWRESVIKVEKAKRAVEHLERFADLWKLRPAALDTMARTSRR